MDYIIREMRSEEYCLLSDFLYEAIYIPMLETKLYFVWKKYQVFTPAAELLLNEMKQYYSVLPDYPNQML